MKIMRKMLALTLAAILTMALGGTVFAAGNGKIKITPPDGTDDGATNTYKVYKVFDADGDGTNISYKLRPNHQAAPTGFSVDTAGNVSYSGSSLTDEHIAALADYVTNEDLMDTVTANGKDPVFTKDLPNGYYYITTTTGTVVTIDSTNPTVEVKDKNTVPSVDKKITNANSFDSDGKKALAQVGTNVGYSAKITVGKGAKNYVFHDKMGKGLKYNEDVEIKVNDVQVNSQNYELTKEGEDTFTIKFKDDYIKTLEVGTEIIVTYSAKITSAALTTNPAKNTAWVSYGDDNSSNKTPDSETIVHNAKFTVTKKNNKQEALEGAGFVLKNSAGKYYKLANDEVSWVDNIGDATEYLSDDQGAVPAFTGLADGKYTLIEKTVPTGYNKAEDKEFTIVKGDYQVGNLEQAATVINNAGSELPSTGGIGTGLFYVLGATLMLLAGGAGILKITRKKMSAK